MRAAGAEEVAVDGDAAVQDSLQARKAGRPQAKRADGARRGAHSPRCNLTRMASLRGQRARARAREEACAHERRWGWVGWAAWCAVWAGRRELTAGDYQCQAAARSSLHSSRAGGNVNRAADAEDEAGGSVGLKTAVEISGDAGGRPRQQRQALRTRDNLKSIRVWWGA
ncbi:hypothetical protein PSPO01_09245 [Paraphaeosphaeria sporulosa]